MTTLTRRETTKLISAGIASAALLPGSALAISRKSFDYGPNRLDWYPARNNPASAPILAYVHGGAWVLGDRKQVHSKPEHFTAKGYHFVSIGYTLFPSANAQTQALQVGAAINWIHQNAQRMGADPNRIALMGHSAGCHLSSLATLTGAALPVKALICNDTRAYDLPFLAKISGGRLPLIYKAPFTRRKLWEAWSPISYTGLKAQPPALVAWSSGIGRDKVSKHFANALERDGVEVHRYNGKRRYTHISIDRRLGGRKDDLTQKIEVFLQDALNRNGKV